MDATTAESKLRLRLQPESEPVLSDEEVTDLLALAATVDADGLDPSDDGWTPTYSVQGIYRAAAEGWQIKDGRVEELFDFTTDGQTFSRSQKSKMLHDKCQHQAAMWKRKLGASIRTGTS